MTDIRFLSKHRVLRPGVELGDSKDMGDLDILRRL
jgi:hypothetical protein